MIKRILTAIRKPTEVQFLCVKDDVGVIPEPYPARKLMPEWFKKLPPKINNEQRLENSTIKRCMPFLDALNLGWIIPLAADVEFATDKDGNITTKSLFARSMVQTHSHAQVAGHPILPEQPWKWINHWAIKMPKGYSMLFVPPLNRYEPRFECIAGMVDDTYMGQDAFEYVNFPFFFKQPKYSGIIKAGTPLVQCIPINRDGVVASSHKIKIDSLSSEDTQLIEHTRRRRTSQESLYRDTLRQPK
jgi:hypothetical protein